MILLKFNNIDLMAVCFKCHFPFLIFDIFSYWYNGKNIVIWTCVSHHDHWWIDSCCINCTNRVQETKASSCHVVVVWTCLGVRCWQCERCPSSLICKITQHLKLFCPPPKKKWVRLFIYGLVIGDLTPSVSIVLLCNGDSTNTQIWTGTSLLKK